MVNVDKGITPSVYDKLQELGYIVSDWDSSKTRICQIVNTVLSTASKKGNGKAGYPDRIFCKEDKNLLIIVEEKPTMKDHDNQDKEKGAISGIKWYLSRFKNSELIDSLKGCFDNWKILGIAVSGDLSKEYQYKFNCYRLDTLKEDIIPITQITNFVTEDDFLAIFDYIDEETCVKQVGKSSKNINSLLRSINSQQRPILLSALMICLYNKSANDFPDHYKTYNPTTLVNNITTTAINVLKSEGIPSEKLDVLETSLIAILKHNELLRTTDILKNILKELEESVIPLFNKRTNYDIIGRFYEEFLKYAGVSNVKKGIVLTPRHITTLFTELIDLKENDRIVDLCCGTGAFLISSMNAIIDKINDSERSDKLDAIAKVKEKQLLGFEIDPTMYICAISNMLFRGDGKSSIYNYDSINNPEVQKILDKFQPTVGFINPPYSGKENNDDPTPKEITFLTKLLDNCSRYAVVIAPLSMYFKDVNIRENILKKHTLKAVINMPKDLFQPNASTHTAIGVFETNRAFDYKNDKVLFYDLREDGFVLTKNKGRTDMYKRWNKNKNELLTVYKNPEKYNNDLTIVNTKIKKKDEWTIYAHCKTDYALFESSFISTLGDYAIYKAKKELGLITKNISEFELLNIINSYFNSVEPYSLEKKNLIDITEWKEFNIQELFDIHGSTTTPKLELEETYGAGEYPYVTTKATNNGIDGFYNHYTEDGNVLTIDSAVNGACFYQEECFSASDHVEILTPLLPEKLNKYTALFIQTILKQEQYKYGYGRKANQTRIKATNIKLPVKEKSNGNFEPDWEYMENYIKSLPYADLI